MLDHFRAFKPYYFAGAIIVLLLLGLGVIGLRILIWQEQNYFDRRGIDAYHHGDFDKAILYSDKAISLNPKDANAYFTKGLAYEDTGDLNKAVVTFGEVIQQNSRFATAFEHRGNCYSRQGDYPSAIENYSQAIQLDPKNAEVYDECGRSYLHVRDFDKAIEVFNQAIQLNPKDTEAFIGCGRAYLQSRDFDKSIQSLKQAISIDPKAADAYEGLAVIRSVCSDAAFLDSKKAIQYSTQACELTGWTDSDKVNTLAMAYFIDGDFDNAANWMSYFLTLPNLSEEQVTRGKTLLALWQAHRFKQEIVPSLH